MTSHWFRRGCRVAAIGVTLFGAQAASAALITASTPAAGFPLNIPDDAYNGTLASMTSSSLTVSAPAGEDVVGDVNVRVTATHDFIGDLTIKLRSPGGQVITLLNRPGGAPDDDADGNADDGSGIGGANANLSAAFPILFDDQALSGVFAEQMGQGLDANGVVGSGLSPANYRPDADTASDSGRLSAFNGGGASGIWTLFLSDSAPLGTGQLQGWEIVVTTIPEPGALTLSLLGATAVLARRRRSA